MYDAIRRARQLVARGEQIDRWIKELEDAELSALAEECPAKRYLITYRCSEDGDGPRVFKRDDRREALVKIVESLKPVAKHSSTSAWIVELHIPQAGTVKDLLRGPLEPAADFLSVCEIVRKNCDSFGDANLA